jgi:hypothetical protein
MENAHAGHAVGKSGNITRVDIPMTSPLLDALRALPDAHAGMKRAWTDEEDAVLLEGRPKIGRAHV